MASIRDRFLYGASGKRTPGENAPREDRPRGAIRKAFFQNIGTMVQYNLIQLLFFLPGIAWSGVNLILLSELLAGVSSLAEGMEKAFPALSTWLMGMIPLWGVADIGACGASAIFQRILQGKRLEHWHDFSGAIRRNGLPAFVGGVLRGALWWMLLTAMNFYSVLAADGSLPFRIFQVLGVVVFLCVLAVEALFLPVLNGMRGRWMDALGTATTQAIWHMPACLSALLLTVALPLALTLIPTVGVLLWGAYELAIGLSVRQYACTAIAALLGIGPAGDNEDGDED